MKESQRGRPCEGRTPMYYYMFVSPRAAKNCGAGLHPARRFLTGAPRFCLPADQRVTNPLQVTTLPHNFRDNVSMAMRFLLLSITLGLAAAQDPPREWIDP